MNLRDFPIDLHRAAKLWAVRLGIPLRTLVIEAVAEKVERLEREQGDE